MRYRVAVRFTDDRQRYHIEDVDADSMTEALEAVVRRVPPSVLGAADLVEVRPKVAEDPVRDYSPG